MVVYIMDIFTPTIVGSTEVVPAVPFSCSGHVEQLHCNESNRGILSVNGSD